MRACACACVSKDDFARGDTPPRGPVQERSVHEQPFGAGPWKVRFKKETEHPPTKRSLQPTRAFTHLFSVSRSPSPLLTSTASGKSHACYIAPHHPSTSRPCLRIISRGRRLDAYDATAARATITFDKARMVVDVSKVPGGDPHRVGSLYQYIGEVDSRGDDGGADEPVLRARVARCVDGLDVKVYNLALHERTKFLKPKSQQPPKS